MTEAEKETITITAIVEVFAQFKGRGAVAKAQKIGLGNGESIASFEFKKRTDTPFRDNRGKIILNLKSASLRKAKERMGKKLKEAGIWDRTKLTAKMQQISA